MAEASPGGSPLLLTIDKSLLECSICCGPFHDPRALPCLHPFCCDCLKNWAKTCSKDKKILSCPLCKKVYQIPGAKGIKGFPAHFMVADLQNSAEKANQLCEEHGEKKIYYCETCGCASCSDCVVLDPTHQGHTFIRLKQAAEQQKRSLENLIRKIQDVKRNFKAEIEHAKQMQLDLNKVTKEKIKAIDEARDEYLQHGYHGNRNHVQQVNKLVKAYRQEVYHKRSVQKETIKQIENTLCSGLTAIGNSCELATNVVESGSDIDITSLYSSLSSTLEELAQCKVSAIDSTLSQFQIKAPQSATADLASLEQLLCDKLHIQVPPSSKIRACHLPPKLVKAAKNPLPSSQPASPTASRGSLSSSPSSAKKTTATYSASSSSNATESRKGVCRGSSWFSCFCCFWSVLSLFFCFMIVLSLLSWFQSAPYVQHEIRRWKKWEEIKIASGVKDPYGIEVHPNGDFVIASSHGPVALFSRAGNLKFTISGSPSNFYRFVVTNDHYFIPGWHGPKLFGVYTYDSQGDLIAVTPTYDIYNELDIPTAVALDSAGRFIVGLYESKTISILQLDGTISKSKTHAHPVFITCAPDDRLIISFDDDTMQVMDQSGHNISIIEPPPGVQPWYPIHVRCSKQGELLMTTSMNIIVWRYQYRGRKFKYQDSTIFDVYGIAGIAFSADGKELFVLSQLNTYHDLGSTHVVLNFV